MGWKTDLILIESEVADRQGLLQAIGRSNHSVERCGTCDEMFPPHSLLIGFHSGCTLVADPQLPTTIIDDPNSPDAHRLVAKFSDRRILCCVLHSVVNLAAFALYEKGELARCFAVSSEDGIIMNTGDSLDAERKVTDQYRHSLGDDGEHVYLDVDGEAYTLDALGEDIVFEVVSTMTGTRLDQDDELFSAPADVYSKPSIIRRLLGRLK